jgi:hypothetical protein
MFAGGIAHDFNNLLTIILGWSQHLLAEEKPPPASRETLVGVIRLKIRILEMMRLTLKTINDELAKRGRRARLAKAGGYFYFRFREAADWFDRTIRVPKISSLTVAEWIAEFQQKLKRLLVAADGGRRQRRRQPRFVELIAPVPTPTPGCVIEFESSGCKSAEPRFGGF